MKKVIGLLFVMTAAFAFAEGKGSAIMTYGQCKISDSSAVVLPDAEGGGYKAKNAKLAMDMGRNSFGLNLELVSATGEEMVLTLVALSTGNKNDVAYYSFTPSAWQNEVGTFKGNYEVKWAAKDIGVKLVIEKLVALKKTVTSETNYICNL